VHRIRDSGLLGWLLLALGIGAGVAMVVTEFLTASEIRIGQAMERCAAGLEVPRSDLLGKCSISGHESHSWALAILGVLAIVMTLGALLGRSRPAAASLAVVGVAAVLIALVIDHPSLHKTRGFEVVATHYAPGSVRSVAGPAYKLELVAGVVALAVGGLALLRDRRAGGAAGAERR
jgi:carbon starvation protein CstA